MAPLLPRYVSTVDSGNLAGHLQTLGQAVSQIAAAPLLHARAVTGPLDALDRHLGIGARCHEAAGGLERAGHRTAEHAGQHHEEQDREEGAARMGREA